MYDYFAVVESEGVIDVIVASQLELLPPPPQLCSAPLVAVAIHPRERKCDLSDPLPNPIAETWSICEMSKPTASCKIRQKQNLPPQAPKRDHVCNTAEDSEMLVREIQHSEELESPYPKNQGDKTPPIRERHLCNTVRDHGDLQRDLLTANHIDAMSYKHEVDRLCTYVEKVFTMQRPNGSKLTEYKVVEQATTLDLRKHTTGRNLGVEGDDSLKRESLTEDAVNQNL
ncbi:uncharacterized protein F5147DRAFT_762061 [Suillus discolor]|uniref:Uncharacterized protein n=1 Tax=Suillus discolor TaxID=1912936 RepID=A0A9P7F4Q3_9AGAM|nr:uncharacterized protein F5147DRAFT_762061 [Suillus discolor]KAG2104720.1 hypothetical protein F5147DRAFT_762061 [Suillus discolor]